MTPLVSQTHAVICWDWTSPHAPILSQGLLLLWLSQCGDSFKTTPCYSGDSWVLRFSQPTDDFQSPWCSVSCDSLFYWVTMIAPVLLSGGGASGCLFLAASFTPLPDSVALL